MYCGMLIYGAPWWRRIPWGASFFFCDVAYINFTLKMVFHCGATCRLPDFARSVWLSIFSCHGFICYSLPCPLMLAGLLAFTVPLYHTTSNQCHDPKLSFCRKASTLPGVGRYVRTFFYILLGTSLSTNHTHGRLFLSPRAKAASP